jgi:hypothetical protein
MTTPAPPTAPSPAAPLHGPWPSPSPWGSRWPGPGRPAGVATVAALPAASVVAAVAIPLDRPGIGWLIAALTGTAALVAARHVTPSLPAGVPPALRRRRLVTLGPERYGWSAATVALLGVGTVRAAEWLFVLCVLTAVGTGTLAVTGGRSLRTMGAGAVIAVAAVFRAVPWFVRGAQRIHRPGRVAGMRVTGTVAVSALLLVVFGSLFASADAAFARLIAHAVPDIDAPLVTRWIVVGVITLSLLGGAAYLRAAPPDLSGMDGLPHRRVARLEWAIPLGLLVSLFGMFVAVQLTVLFGGSRYVLATDGLTYAQHARGGFWQLLTVTGLTLLVLAGAVRWAPRDTARDRTLIRVVLGALAGLTCVIVASALYRMNVYSDTYGLTRLRVLVWLCELWLGVVFLLIIGAGVRLRAAWLPQVAGAVGVSLLLGLAVANPDGMIARHNVARDRVDADYLGTLSADAVPAVMRLDPSRRGCVTARMADRLERFPDDWRGWNLGRERARRIVPHAEPCRNP